MAGPRYVRLVVGTRELALSPRAILDDDTVYAPTDVLKELGANFVEGKRKVSVLQGEDTQEIDLKSQNGVPMVNMDDVAKTLDVERVWDEQTSTLRLLGKLVSVEYDNGTLTARVTAPTVVTSMRLWKQPWRLSIDLAGAKVATETRAQNVGGSDISQVRVGQFEDTTARIVIDLAGKRPYTLVTKGASREIKLKIGSVPKSTAVRPATEAKPATDTDTTPAEKADPIKITAITPEPDGDGKMCVRVKTSGRPAINTLTLNSPPRVAVDFKNSVCELSETEITVDHALAKSIRYGKYGDGIRLVIESVGSPVFYAEPDGDDIVLRLRQPRSSGGKLSDKTVVIDAGHGGNDPGARGGDTREKTVNLALAHAVRSALEAAGVRVVMTRENDTFVQLKDRPAVADQNSADFFVSIHCNAIIPERLTGTETYYHGGAETSRALASAIQGQVIRRTGMKDKGVKKDTIRFQSGFAVLRNANVPAVLIEAGFIDCTADRTKLCDDSWRGKFARGVVDGLRLYVEGTIGAEDN